MNVCIDVQAMKRRRPGMTQSAVFGMSNSIGAELAGISGSIEIHLKNARRGCCGSRGAGRRGAYRNRPGPLRCQCGLAKVFCKSAEISERAIGDATALAGSQAERTKVKRGAGQIQREA